MNKVSIVYNIAIKGLVFAAWLNIFDHICFKQHENTNYMFFLFYLMYTYKYLYFSYSKLKKNQSFF